MINTVYLIDEWVNDVGLFMTSIPLLKRIRPLVEHCQIIDRSCVRTHMWTSVGGDHEMSVCVFGTAVSMQYDINLNC